jgi:hypothetical protein
MMSPARWLPAWFRPWLVALALWVAAPAAAMPAGGFPELPTGPAMSAAADAPGVRPRRVEVPAAWHTVHGEHLRLHGPARHVRLLEALRDHADPRVPEIAARLGATVGGPIDVFLSSTDEEFRRVQPGEPPAWADATAYPALGAVYLRAPMARGGDPEPLTKVLDHELVHIVVGRHFAPRPAPTWLQEGLAQLHAGQYDATSVRRLSAAALSGPIPLDELERAFPRNPHAASLAYAQSVDFLAWLERTHGAGSIAALVERLRFGDPLADAILAVTGRPLHEVDAAWSSRFSHSPTAVLTAIGSPDFMWFVAAVVGVAAMFVVRRRQRRRRAVIRRRERRERELLQDFIDRYGRLDAGARRSPFRDLDPPRA